ncbi:polysaccharide deacetylase [Sulfitobacter alexandrii]|uniref:Polysaccharide deacetylase n=1 Tax=Sulfitobacter alexandrii TaxID=1917485 RepID=A0A1J0WJN9_9RHOB|nr:polysaccharide deacetylase family protein [Sulfitobacter alexandrii]APE44540.1 polysaccharide deacetylase [Sulfitobacter alexandrii]
MSIDWSPLTAELARWRAEARDLPLWWRDDDATEPTAALDRLLTLSAALDMPVHLAVIPRAATDGLADRLRGVGHATTVVHGWAHENHAPPGRKKAEFGQPRPDAVADAEAGLTRLRHLFGDGLLDLFVPPWNRIDSSVVEALPGIGFRGLSTYTPRPAREAAPGLVQINTHVDPIHWRGGGGLVDADILIAALVAHLEDRRAGRADAAEPLGLLTHHLVHDSAIWEFTHACLSTLLMGGARPINLLHLKGPLP